MKYGRTLNKSKGAKSALYRLVRNTDFMAQNGRGPEFTDWTILKRGPNHSVSSSFYDFKIMSLLELRLIAEAKI